MVASPLANFKAKITALYYTIKLILYLITNITTQNYSLFMEHATSRVLGSSIINAASGWFRMCIAFLLVGEIPDFLLCLAFSFVVYAVYTLDRTLKSREDEVNRPELKNANKSIIFFIVSSFLISALLILGIKKVSPLAAFLPFIIGYIYTKGVKIGSVTIKFKQGFGIKNFVVAFTWGFTIVAFIFNFIEYYLQVFLVFAFFFFKSFINTVIFDCKDVEGDSMAGLATIPVYFGEKATRIILQLMNSSFHLSIVIFMFSGLLKFDNFILYYSWAAGLIYISLFANGKKTIMRSLVVHGEYAHMLAFRNLALQFSQNALHSS